MGSLIIFAFICLVLVGALMATGVVLEKDKNKLEAKAKEKRKLRFFRPKSGLPRFTWSTQKSTVKTEKEEEEDA